MAAFIVQIMAKAIIQKYCNKEHRKKLKNYFDTKSGDVVALLIIRIVYLGVWL